LQSTSAIATIKVLAVSATASKPQQIVEEKYKNLSVSHLLNPCLLEFHNVRVPDSCNKSHLKFQTIKQQLNQISSTQIKADSKYMNQINKKGYSKI